MPQKNEILEKITIEKLIFGGKGLGIAPDGKKILISGGVIPGSVIDVRILKSRTSYYEGQQLRVVEKSPIEIPLPEGYQLYGGAKWLTIAYDEQLRIKEEQVQESLYSISKFLLGEQHLSHGSSQNQSASSNIRTLEHSNPRTFQPSNLPLFHPIIRSPEIYRYRNKVEFSWGKYISAKEGIHDDFRFGFHAQGQFDRIEDCQYCALADNEMNAIFREVDTLSRASGLPTYDPKTGKGFWRHLVIRRGNTRDEIMLIFSVNGVYDEGVGSFFSKIVQQLTEKYSNIASIFFLENTGRADIVTGNPVLLFGKPSIEATLLGLTFEIQPKSFFQVNTLGAEKLYTAAIEYIKNKGGILYDLYAGTGTIGILLSPYFDTVYSVELVESASADGEKNADKNGIKNVQFIQGKVEDFVKESIEKGRKADTIVLDPPRDGLHPSALEPILVCRAKEIIYISCNPATLARDLEVLIGKTRSETGKSLPTYEITDVTPVDMFPHTHHIETIVRLTLRD